MTENFEKITSGSNHPGQTCAFCQQPITLEDEVVVCPRCRSVHHVDCWKAKGGCGKQGCPQIAKAIVGEPPAGDGPPPPISKKVIFGGVAIVLALILLSVFWPKPPDPAQGRTRIVFLGEAYYDLNIAMTDLTEQFNDTNEEIYIDLQLLPPGSVDQKLVVLIAAREAPDVIAIDDHRFDYFAEQGVLLALGEDEHGEPIYGIQHPGQLSKLMVWGATDFPEQALEVLYYFVDNIPQADLDLMRETDVTPFPSFGF